jgi:hypothetical protein
MSRTATGTVTETTPSQLKSIAFGPRSEDSVEAILNYWKEDSQILRQNECGLSDAELRVARRSDNSPTINRTLVRIKDMRSDFDDYSLSTHGFQVCHFDSAMIDWSDDAALKKIYFKEVSELLKKVTGAIHVHSYEHHIRQKSLEEALARPGDGEVDIQGPIRRVHIDESPRSARREFNYYLPPAQSDFNASLHGRPFGIYNIWKPLKTVQRDPLCVCDARSLEFHDLVPGAVTVPNVGEIENFSIRAPRVEGRHQWHFLKDQKPDEALVFKIFDERDEDAEGNLQRFGVAHTSFVHPGTEGLEARESVEIRSFCIF